MIRIVPYDREAAVSYAHRWAYGRNPLYYDYENLGGDCTNFASQVLYAGIGIMNFTPDLGWYYRDANDKAPAWSGVEFFWNFMTRKEKTVGPFGRPCALRGLKPWDFVQLWHRREGRFGHTPVVVDTGSIPTLRNTLVAAHSEDADYRPLSSYSFQKIRFLHILGGRAEERVEIGE